MKKRSQLKDRDLEQIEQEVKDIVDASVEFARQSPLPEPDELYDDIYSGDYPDLKRRDPWR